MNVHPIKAAASDSPWDIFLKIQLADQLIKHTANLDTQDHERFFYDRERLAQEFSHAVFMATGLTAEQIAEVMA